MPGKAEYKLDPCLLQRFDALREEAVHEASTACLKAWPRLEERFGRRASQFCREDIGYHLDFLRPVLETGELSVFIAYLGWLRQVLLSRGVPDDSLSDSLSRLSEFYQAQLGDGAEPLVRALMAGKQALADGVEAPYYGSDCDVPLPADVEAFRDALLAGDQRRARTLFNEALDRERDVSGVAVNLVQPALYEVGRLWQENRVSVAQEHLASAMVQTLLAQGCGRVEPAPDNGHSALFACVAGNEHAIGLRMIADSFEFAGWHVDYLGANTPLAALVSQIRQSRPELIGLSAALPWHLKTLREAIDVLRAAFADDCPRIAVGGLVINQFPPLAANLDVELLGRDAAETFKAAFQAAENL